MAKKVVAKKALLTVPVAEVAPVVVAETPAPVPTPAKREKASIDLRPTPAPRGSGGSVAGRRRLRRPGSTLRSLGAWESRRPVQSGAVGAQHIRRAAR